MDARLPRVFTIPSDEPFLDVLARAILAGFPGEDQMAPAPFELARYRILLPTRRAARELERVFHRLSGKAGLLLPRIMPIGDVDEELLEANGAFGAAAELSLPKAISPIGRDLLLLDLISAWAKAHSQSALAAEILASPQQALALARSMAELADGLEIEEIDPAGIAELYGLDSSRHREAITGFLALVRDQLPARLGKLGVMSPAARRSLLLRHEAARLNAEAPAFPVIAAGSTGSIPATRELLKSIALLPRGAVILPGLDQFMDEASWAAVGAQHPQFALKQLLAHFNISRHQALVIPDKAGSRRSWLTSEIMRPTDTTPEWGEVIRNNRARLTEALNSVELVEAANVHLEAKVIALILRNALEISQLSASLVTPDRELARRVKQELQGYGIAIDDSAGEPLIRFDGAAVLGLVIDSALGHFTADGVAALLKQRLCNFGMPVAQARRAADVVEIAVFRTGLPAPELGALGDSLHAAQGSIAADSHAHPVLRAISDHDWQLAHTLAAQVVTCLQELPRSQLLDFASHLDALTRCCERICGRDFWSGESGATLRLLIDSLRVDSGHMEQCSFEQAAAIIRHYLAATPFRRTATANSRLSILGLLEARLTRPDWVVLGGLNEGRWPALPDSGPWLNRPMREILGMQQPEHRIGQTAHDLAQALGCGRVFLIWSRRVGDAPAIPSRWILRLQMLMKAAGLENSLGPASKWNALAAKLREPAIVSPCKKPRPKPPVPARPKKLSVTRIETLIRDPYAIYAQDVLGLRPLDDLSTKPDLALRGTIIHRAIGEFLARYPIALPSDALEYLIERGQAHLAPYAANPGVAVFWSAQFQRIAEWLAGEENNQRKDVKAVFAEIGGRIEFEIAGDRFTLTCRADRIDVLTNGAARIADYKTGGVPTAKQVTIGLAPQLTLQAAMLEKGAFAKLGTMQTQEIAYVKLGIGDPPGQLIVPDLKQPVMACARQHFAGLCGLLEKYANQEQCYLPRTIVETEDEVREFDHLSRFREWALAGDGS